MADWTEEMSVGVEVLDNDHRTLFDLINKLKNAILNDAATQVLDEILDELYDYTDYHFRREEAMMILCGYPDLADHKALHKEMTSRIEQFLEPPPRNTETNTYAELLDFLENWWTDHIMVVDKTYGPFIAGREGIVEQAKAEVEQAPGD